MSAMTIQATGEGGRGGAADGSRRRGAMALAGALGILLAGIVAMDLVQRWWAVVIVKTPAKLAKPLSELPTTLGVYEREDKVDHYLPEEQVAVLGTPDYLLRDYVDKGAKAGEPGYMVSLNLNFYAVGTATPHVPRFCWAGAGMTEQQNRIMTVKNVLHKDGTTSDVRMQLLSFSGKQIGVAAAGGGGAEEGGTADRYLNVAYMFQVNDGYVATGEEVQRHFWKPFAKYAYHTKIEVTVRQACTPDEAQAAVEGFIRASLAQIEECLPDARALAAEAAREDGKSNETVTEAGH